MTTHPITRNVLAASWRSWWDDQAPRVQPRWLRLLWTLLLSLAVALLVSGLGVAFSGQPSHVLADAPVLIQLFASNLVLALTVGFAIHLLFAIGRQMVGVDRLAGLQGWQRSAYYALVPLLGVAISMPPGAWIAHRLFGMRMLFDADLVLGAITVSLLISAAMHLYLTAHTRQIQAEKQAAEAQLRLLQAQIEPHFLFNTLANVTSLIEPAPVKAKQMLEAFTDYLRSSLGSIRSEDSSVGAEVDLAQAYLGLIQVRMEDRLHVQIDVDLTLRTQAMPPLLIQPLVENAIQHGLEPKIEGGTLVLLVQRSGDELMITVHDNGLGLAAPARPGRQGNGVALQNVRQRLLSRFGSAAVLTLEEAWPGTRATLRMPLSSAWPSPSMLPPRWERH
jgi:two-component sensor histidine kinase